MGGMVLLTSFSLLTSYISLSPFFSLIESHENTIVEFFFWYLHKWECKKYICGTLPFTALQVNPTMMTSAAEKPGNVKKVHCLRLTSVEESGGSAHSPLALVHARNSRTAHLHAHVWDLLWVQRTHHHHVHMTKLIPANILQTHTWGPRLCTCSEERNNIKVWQNRWFNVRLDRQS